MSAKVSFVLPAYKRQFLYEAIVSILNQTYRDFELIIVDDCSPEKLREVVDSISDKRVTYYHNDENIGGKDLIAAWNHALNYANGEWCILASDDDIYAPEYLEEMMRLSEKYPLVDLFHCRPGVIDVKGEVYEIGAGRIEIESCLQLVYYRSILRCQQTMPDFMFRRSALRECGGFVFTPDAMHSDDATWVSISRKHGCVCSPRMLFFWRNSGSNVSMRTDNIKRKIVASQIYLKWVTNVVSEIIPRNNEEITLKKLILKNLPLKCEKLIRSGLTRVSLYHWICAITTLHFSHSLLLRIVYDRICIAINPLNWLRTLKNVLM